MTNTATETLSVVVEREIPFPPEKIWRALTQPHLIEEWLMKNDFKPVWARGPPLKHFMTRGDAIAFATTQLSDGNANRADIYEVADTNNPRAAVAAVVMGAAPLLKSRGPRVSEAEQARADRLKGLRGLRWEDLFPGSEGP